MKRVLLTAVLVVAGTFLFFCGRLFSQTEAKRLPDSVEVMGGGGQLMLFDRNTSTLFVYRVMNGRLHDVWRVDAPGKDLIELKLRDFEKEETDWPKTRLP